jgi:protein-arginine kinase activator protein McsA
MEYEELFVLNEFSEIIKYHNTALDRIKRFQEAYPYLIAPNIFDTIQHNLRDNITILFREMAGMKDQKNKQYEKKFVCKICHGVYMMSLPNGICDECRGRYGGNVMKMIKPENNGKKTNGDTPGDVPVPDDST